MRFEWEVVGSSLLERERRPAVVLDLDGRVVRINNAFRHFLEEDSCTRTQPSAEDWLHPDSRSAFREAWQRALTGERTRVGVALHTTASHLEPVFDVLPLTGTGSVVSVMLVMIDAVAPGSAVPLVPPLGRHYQVALDGEGRPGRVVRMLSDEKLASADRATPCFRRLHGRERACEVCPLTSPPSDSSGPVVRIASHSPFKAQLLSARRDGSDLATVSEVPLGENSYGRLVEARIDSLATQAKLTARERSTLSLLLLGRSLDDVGQAEGISARTAKYHQQNLLRKLGAESRVDLFRLLR